MAQEQISPVKTWILSIRPKTLPASMAPVVIGVALAYFQNKFVLLPALAALAGSILLQIGVNLANDYFDYTRGVDAPGRLGPQRVTQSGMIEPRRMKAAMLAVFGMAALLGIYLVYIGGIPILAIGLASILSALAYSGGPYPLASHGLGDIFVFIFFGLVAVCGTYYVQALELNTLVILCSLPAGFLITAILVVNNLRDISSDRLAGKRTLAVILGARGSRMEYLLLVLASYATLPVVWYLGNFRPWILLPLLSAVLAWKTTSRIFKASGSILNDVLASTAKLSLVYSVLFSLGIVLSA